MRQLNIFFRLQLIFLFTVIMSCSPDAKSPNIILILTDDQGYGDLGCIGNPVIKTPNLDQLHEQSVRFTNFHVDPTCAPTRAALMTGKYSHHAGVWHTICGGNHLRASEMTMADAFKENGYATGLFGKWHLGSNYPYRPIERGFDEWLGHGDGGTGTTDDWFDNDRVNDHYWHNGERIKKEGFAPDVFFSAAIDFIKSNKEKKKPFFVYLASYLPHDPHTLPEKSWADKYTSSVSDRVAYFFAGIERIDQNIGNLQKVLDEYGLAENTIIIFMSDNGGTAGVRLFNAGMRGNKGQVYDGGHRVPFFIKWPDGKLKHGSDVGDLTAHIDLLPSLVELCGLSIGKDVEFDGRSFKQQLYQPELDLPERTLFVEKQRTFIPEPWENTVGMTGRWRLVDNKELYDMENDPGQSLNVIGQHPGVVEHIIQAHSDYWTLVSPGDRDKPRFIVGHSKDPEIFLQASDWYLPAVPWNHAQVASGEAYSGSWDITISRDGLYRFEVSRWPREANATIQGIPSFHKTVDAWTAGGGIEKLIYGSQMTALPVRSIRLEVGKYAAEKQVNPETRQLFFDVNLEQGDMQVRGSMLDAQGMLIAGAYYIYVTHIESTESKSEI